MLTKIFRAVDADGRPTGYRGFVTGANLTEVFWAIDEFIDPHTVEIANMKSAGICFYLEDDDCDSEKHEVSDGLAICYDKEYKWKRINWSNVLEKHKRGKA